MGLRNLINTGENFHRTGALSLFLFHSPLSSPLSFSSCFLSLSSFSSVTNDRRGESKVYIIRRTPVRDEQPSIHFRFTYVFQCFRSFWRKVCLFLFFFYLQEQRNLSTQEITPGLQNMNSNVPPQGNSRVFRL